MRSLLLIAILASVAHADDSCDTGNDCKAEHDCDAGAAAACVHAGITSADRFPAHARVRFEKACDLGNSYGCYASGLAYEKAKGTRADAAKARSYFERACALNDPASCAQIADLDASQGLAAEAVKDYDGALKLYEHGCGAHSDVSCDLLGFLLEHGLGAPVDYARAFSLYQGACSGTLPKACYDEARMYLDGKGVPQSDRAASDLFEKTCEADGYGCAELAHLIRLGRAPGLLARAEALDRKGCDAGISEACGDLATVLEHDPNATNGQVVDTYAKACDGGHMASCYRLGVLYATGDIVEKNADKAHLLFIRACEHGNAAACSAGAAQLPGGQ